MSILDQYDADRAAQQAEAEGRADHHQFMESVRRDPEWAVAHAEKERERERAEDHARGELGGAA